MNDDREVIGLDEWIRQLNIEHEKLGGDPSNPFIPFPAEATGDAITGHQGWNPQSAWTETHDAAETAVRAKFLLMTKGQII